MMTTNQQHSVVSFLLQIQSLTTHNQLSQGKQLHSVLLKSGHLPSLFASNSLLQMYSRCSPNPSNAHQVFDEMPQRNPFSYNSLVDSYLNSKNTSVALSLFNLNPHKNSYSWSAMLGGLSKCGDLDNARRVFDDMPVKDAPTFNSLLHGYFRNGKALEAFSLYRKVNLNDKFILATVISGCTDHEAFELGKQIHGRIIVSRVEMDSVLGSTLVDMYGKCEDLDSARRVLDSMDNPDEFSLSALITGYSNCSRLMDARRVFDKKRNPGVVMWNSMISGYVLNGLGEEALHLFNEMRREEGCSVDSSTFASILSACASFRFLIYVKQIHACALKHGIMEDIIVTSAVIDSYSKSAQWEDACRVFSEVKVHDTVMLNSMINVYSNYGRIEEARWVFESIMNKSLISWNSMVVGYSQNGCAIEALDLFAEMHRNKVRLDKVALASAISASACICALKYGEQMFALAIVIGLDYNQIISTSLIDLYCKCGNVLNGRRLFDEMTKCDKAIWNSMLMGYASNGYGIEALKLFEAMRNVNVAPNEITFIAILSGCCHSGLVEEGLSWFYRMKEEYGINLVVEHYSLVVDLLVRAGRLEEAISFIDTMPFEADASMWTSVLGGCKACGDELLGSKVADRLIKLDLQQCGPFVQLSSVYAARGEWDRSARIRGMMQDRRIRKNPGYSWIDN